MSLRSALRDPFEVLATRELQPVEVAVVDSGIDATHPDLAGRVVRAFSVEVEGDEAVMKEQPSDTNLDVYGHGTAVGSIIARIAPNARLVDIRVLNVANVGAGIALLRGFQYAVETRIRVINMSLAATAKFAPQLQTFCELAYRQNQLVLAARRNMPLVDNGYPAELSSTISVDAKRFASEYQVEFREDHAIEFVGHGEDVKVAAAGGGYSQMTGTSFATPAVCGLCALLVGACPDLRPFDIKSLLKAFAT